MHRTDTAVSDRSDVTLAEGEEHPNPLGQEAMPEVTNAKEAEAPQLSWFMNVAIIAVVSMVRPKHSPYQRSTIGILTGSSVAGRWDCRLVGGDGEREFRDRICQRGVDSSRSVSHCAGDCRYVGGFVELEIDYNGFFCRLCDRCERVGQGSTDIEQCFCRRFYDRK